MFYNNKPRQLLVSSSWRKQVFKQVVKNWNAFPPNLWWFVCLENIVNTTVSVPITNINHRLHVWRWCDVYSPTSGFYLRRSYWGSWKRLNIWRCPRRRWPCSDRICGPRESPWRGTRSGPAIANVWHSAKSNPTLHNTIHDTISSFIYLSPALLCASVHIAKFKQFTEIISLSEIMISFTCTVMLVSGVVPSNVSTTLKCIISILSINSITIHFKAVNRTSRNFTGLLQSHLEVVCLHVPGREAVEGRPLVYPVSHH